MDKKSESKGEDPSTESETSIGEMSDGNAEKPSTMESSTGEQKNVTERENSPSTAPDRSSKRTNAETQEQEQNPMKRQRTRSVSESSIVAEKGATLLRAQDADVSDTGDISKTCKATVEGTEKRLKRTSAVAKDTEEVCQKRPKTTLSDGIANNGISASMRDLKVGNISDAEIRDESTSSSRDESTSSSRDESTSGSRDESTRDSRDESTRDSRDESTRDSRDESTRDSRDESTRGSSDESTSDGSDESTSAIGEETEAEKEERDRVTAEYNSCLKRHIAEMNKENEGKPARKNEMPRRSVAEITNEFKTQSKVVVARFGELLENLETDLKAIAAEKLKVLEALRELCKLISNPCFDIKENRPSYDKRRAALKIAISRMREPNIKILHDLSLSLENAIPSLCFLLSELEVSPHYAAESGQKEEMCVNLKGYNEDTPDCQGCAPDKIETVVVEPFKHGVLWLRAGVKERFYSFFEAGFGGNESTETENQMNISISESQSNVTPVRVKYSAAEYLSKKLFSFKTKWHDISLSLHQQFSELQKDVLENSMMLVADDVFPRTYELVGRITGAFFMIDDLLKSIEEHCRFCMDVIVRFQIFKPVPPASSIPK